jgi:hypothetical protein
MISEEKVLVLSQLVTSLKEAVLEFEREESSRNSQKISQIKERIFRLNKEIKENLV